MMSILFKELEGPELKNRDDGQIIKLTLGNSPARPDPYCPRHKARRLFAVALNAVVMAQAAL